MSTRHLNPPDNHHRTVLVTGGTGFLGSHIAVRLLTEGHRVLLLARGRQQQSPIKRVCQLLDWFNVGKSLRTRLEVLEGDINHPLLGLSVRDRDLLAQAAEIVHCASDTSFSTRMRKQVEETNLFGLNNLLDAARGSYCREFHLISTAYVAGKADGLCPEEFADTNAFHNDYERTKYQAERIAAHRCAQNRITLFIHRPSIVYGDSTTGRTILFNALYYPIRTIHYFQRLYTKDILENNGNKARAMGIRLGKDGVLHLPIRIGSSNEHGVNLIPVDHFIRAFMAIRRQIPEGGIFHIVNPKDTSIKKLVDYIQRHFRISGLRIADPEEFARLPHNGLELLFENHNRTYGPYLQDTRVFEHSRTSAILAKDNIACPDFSYDIFSNCMRYAVDVAWGRQLFDALVKNRDQTAL